MKNTKNIPVILYPVLPLISEDDPTGNKTISCFGKVRAHRRYDEKKLPPLPKAPSDRRRKTPGTPLRKNKPQPRYN